MPRFGQKLIADGCRRIWAPIRELDDDTWALVDGRWRMVRKDEQRNVYIIINGVSLHPSTFRHMIRPS